MWKGSREEALVSCNPSPQSLTSCLIASPGKGAAFLLFFFLTPSHNDPSKMKEREKNSQWNDEGSA